MKTLFNFFLNKIDNKNEIVYAKAKLFLILSLTNIILLSVLTISLIVQGVYENMATKVIPIFVYIILVVLIKQGKQKIAGNIFTILLSLTISLSVILNFSNNLIYDYFVNGFYFFLFIIVFSAMFASRIIFVGSFFIMFISSIVAYINTNSKLPESFIKSAENGFVVYMFVMLMIFIILS